MIGSVQGITFELLKPELPDTVIIRGEGEVVDPDKWTEFPTPPPVNTNAPTPYPTPLSPAPTLINYLLLDNGATTKCSAVGIQEVPAELCLDAVQLVGRQYNFPFYVDTLPTDDTKPCGCFLWTKDNGSKMVEFNECGPAPKYTSLGRGICSDRNEGSAYLPAYIKTSSSSSECQDTCNDMDDCNAYTLNTYSDECKVHFASLTDRDANDRPAGWTSYDGCGNSCNSNVVESSYGATTVYEHDNYGGQSVTFPIGNYAISSMVSRGAPNDWISSIRVDPGYRLQIFEHGSFDGQSTYLYPGNYNTDYLEDNSFGNDQVSSLKIVSSGTGPICYRKYIATPAGVANADTQLVCELAEPISGSVDDDASKWSKLYGAGTRAGGKYSTWPTFSTDLPFYIRRTCPSCADSHKTIVYKRLTALPYGYDIENLFLDTWASTNNNLNVDFELYSSMGYAQAGLFKWTSCNYNDNGIGFPRDCGGVGGQWNSLTRGGQPNYQFDLYLEPTNPVTPSGNDSGLCVGSNTEICGCSIVDQSDYRGTINTTRSGRDCQEWTSDSPHPHDYLVSYPGTGIVGGHNYCRNPGSDSGGAWCYTTDPNVQWEYCNVPMCTFDGIISDWWNHFPYNGHVSAHPTPAPTFFGDNAQCHESYIELSLANRNINNSGGSVTCDQGSRSDHQFQGSSQKWYRFTGAAGTQMPESAPPTNVAGTHAPGWLNGAHPNTNDGVVSRQVCFHWSGNTCQWHAYIEVVACGGGYYLYNLPATPVCSLRYAGQTV